MDGFLYFWQILTEHRSATSCCCKGGRVSSGLHDQVFALKAEDHSSSLGPGSGSNRACAFGGGGTDRESTEQWVWRSKTIHKLYKAFGVGVKEATIAVCLALFYVLMQFCGHPDKHFCQEGFFILESNLSNVGARRDNLSIGVEMSSGDLQVKK